MSIQINDGGYYAIKGFAYQIDKAILELLNSNNDNNRVNIEQIQDIDTDAFVIQVKYKETAKLTPSQVNKPIIQLIKEFKKNSNKKYILYCYFQDLNGYANKVDNNGKVSLSTLNELLGTKSDIDNVTNEDKENFIKNFVLDFSPEFQKQFNLIISKLKDLDLGKTDEEIIFYYSNISDYLYKKVINNPAVDIENRKCTKKEIVDYLKSAKNIVFNSNFREYKGKEEYFKFIKKQNSTYLSNRNIDYFERFIVIELLGNETISDIKEIIYKLKDKFCKISGSFPLKKVKSPAPYIYFRNITSEKLVQLKQNLQQEGLIFKDGFDYQGAEFSIKSIKKGTTIYNNLCIKFINSKIIFNQLVNNAFSNTKIVYQFFINERVLIPNDIKNIEIQIKNIEDIIFII